MGGERGEPLGVGLEAGGVGEEARLHGLEARGDVLHPCEYGGEVASDEVDYLKLGSLSISRKRKKGIQNLFENTLIRGLSLHLFGCIWRIAIACCETLGRCRFQCCSFDPEFIRTQKWAVFQYFTARGLVILRISRMISVAV
jgi:hypothetical protein